MSLKHPQKPPRSTRDLAVDPMLTMGGEGIPGTASRTGKRRRRSRTRSSTTS